MILIVCQKFLVSVATRQNKIFKFHYSKEIRRLKKKDAVSKKVLENKNRVREVIEQWKQYFESIKNLILLQPDEISKCFDHWLLDN